MGAMFQLAHANLIAYLSSHVRNNMLGPSTPRYMLSSFLMYLRDGVRDSAPHLISHDGAWAEQVRSLADHLLDGKRRDPNFDPWSNKIVPREEVTDTLRPLKGYFSDYQLYALIVPGREHSRNPDRTRNLFERIAIESGRKGIVLMPQDWDDHIEVLEPFEPIRKLAETPLPLPAVLFWTPAGSACVERMDSSLLDHILPKILNLLERGGRRLDEYIESRSRKPQIKKILHMSDLHFGRAEATRRRAYLKAQLSTILHDIDRVVITGDLFDEPKEAYRAEFDEFRADVEKMTRHELVVVPGNHDVRRKGNQIIGIGEEFSQLADLSWDPVEVDDDNQTVFFCFNSAEQGRQWARGGVGVDQLRKVGTRFLNKQGKDPNIAHYLKVALVHHHPYPYGNKVPAFADPVYHKLIKAIWPNEDHFLEFEDSAEFMRWCNDCGVEIVLHGHKHRPRQLLNNDKILVVGCGSTTGAENTPMTYNIISRDTESGRWNPSFYFDQYADGSGFKPLSVRLNIA